MSPKLREFLDYINGKTPDGELTKRLDEAIKRAKSMESWRKEYMFLYEIKDEGRQEAREQLQELCEKMMADDRGSEYLDVMKSRNSARIDALLQEYGIADES